MTRILLIGAVILAAAVSPAGAAGDPAAGEGVFKKCAACHAIGEGAQNRIGPQLNDLLGRVAGSAEGFAYSQGLVDAGKGGLVWTPETLGPWLHRPKDVVPATRMTFAGLANQADIDNVIAYLGTFSPGYVPAAPMDSPSSAAQ